MTQYAILVNTALYTQYVIYYSSALYIKLISFIYYTTAYARRRVRVRREITNIGNGDKKSFPAFNREVCLGKKVWYNICGVCVRGRITNIGKEVGTWTMWRYTTM